MHARVDSYFSLPLSIHLSIASSSFSFPRVRIFHLLPSLSLIFIAESFAATLTSNIGGGVFIALKGDAADVDDGVGHVFALLAVLDDVIVTGALFSSPKTGVAVTPPALFFVAAAIGFPPHSIIISSTLGFPSVKYKIFSIHLAKTSFSNSGR